MLALTGLLQTPPLTTETLLVYGQYSRWGSSGATECRIHAVSTRLGIERWEGLAFTYRIIGYELLVCASGQAEKHEIGRWWMAAND